MAKRKPKKDEPKLISAPFMDAVDPGDGKSDIQRYWDEMDKRDPIMPIHNCPHCGNPTSKDLCDNCAARYQAYQQSMADANETTCPMCAEKDREIAAFKRLVVALETDLKAARATDDDH